MLIRCQFVSISLINVCVSPASSTQGLNLSGGGLEVTREPAGK